VRFPGRPAPSCLIISERIPLKTSPKYPEFYFQKSHVSPGCVEVVDGALHAQ